jgi:RNA ligase (TIGR02306 family)
MSEINRNLVSIQRVSSVRKHPNADTLDIIGIKGWEVISKSGTHSVDDLVCYFEIDSFLPVEPHYEFLRKSGFRSTKNLGDGFRLRTIKLRGEISQGLILPLDEFPEYFVKENGQWLLKVVQDVPGVPLEKGYDLTYTMGVQKYEAPIPSNLMGVARGNFPSFVPKTDEERFENLTQRHIRGHENDTFEITVKVDGSSMTVYQNLDLEEGLQFGVCSRNFDLEETEDNTYWKVANEFKLRELLKDCGKSIALQGELAGPGVNKNTARLATHGYYVFNIWSIDEKRYFSAAEREAFLAWAGIRNAPVIDKGFVGLPDRESLKEIADNVLFNDLPAEGVVFKSLDDPGFSFKKISAKYLLKNDE